MNTPTSISLGFIGLGRMGANMTRRIARAGIAVVGYDQSEAAGKELRAEAGFHAASSVASLIGMLRPPRQVWLMLPAGDATEAELESLTGLLAPGDVIIDGGNADYRDSQRRAQRLAQHQIRFVDIGVSGGVWGLQGGYCLMFGGTKDAVDGLMPVFRALAPAPDSGWVHCGPSGSGHFAKMIHNGIEYGLMQAYAEGFALLAAKQEFNLNLADIARTWQHGSVVRSWLLELGAHALADPSRLAQIAPVVSDSGEGRWTVRESVDMGIPAPVITMALATRFASQGKGDFASRYLARLRNLFGGHAMGIQDQHLASDGHK